MLFYRVMPLVIAGKNSNGIARMIIENGQRMAVALIGFEVALEVHLPEFVGLRTFKALAGSMLGGFLGRDQLMAMQNAGDGAGRRDIFNALVAQYLPQRAAAPLWAFAAQGHHERFCLR